MARPRKSEERDTRRDILEAALDLFAENGFFGTSMRDVAKRVGVRESALYHHFESKEAIMLDLLRQFGPGQAQRFAPDDVGTLLEAYGGLGFLQHLAQLMITTWATSHEEKIFRVVLSEGSRFEKSGVVSLPSFVRQARQRISGIFSEMMRRKMIRKADPITVAMGFFAPLMMLRVLYLVMPKEPRDVKGLKAEVDRYIAFYWQRLQ